MIRVPIRHLRASFLAIMLFQSLSLSFAQDYKFPRLAADEKIKTLSKEDLNADTLFDLFFWASTVEPVIKGSPANFEDEKSSYKTKLEDLMKTLTAEIKSNGIKNEKERAEYILKFLHKNLFTSYSAYQTRLDTLLTNGRFNCVSSALAYSIFAKYSGIESKGVITKDHAFICLNIDGENIDIETTNPYGFDPGKRTDFHDDFGKTTGFAYTPPGNYRLRQTITLLELSSIVLRNRISDLERAQKYADAVPLAIDRMTLLRNRENATVSPLFGDPVVEADDAIFNLNSFYLNKKQETAVLAWVDATANVVTDKKRLHESEIAAINNLMVKYLRAKKIDEAERSLSENEKRLTEAELNKFKGMTLEASLAEIVNAAKNDETTVAALGRIDTAEKTGLLEAKRINELKQIVIKNRVAFFHNTFALEFNKKNYENAKTILQKAILEFPENKTFASDMKTLEKVNVSL